MSGYHPHDVIVVIVAGPIRAVVGQESAKHHSITGLEDCVPDLLQRTPRFSTRSAGDVVVTCLLAQDAICSKPPGLLVAGRGGESGSFQDLHQLGLGHWSGLIGAATHSPRNGIPHRHSCFSMRRCRIGIHGVGFQVFHGLQRLSFKMRPSWMA